MGFEFINHSDADTPEEIVGLVVYYFMMYGGEETIQSGIVHDILNLSNFEISESAIALKLEKLKNDGDLRYLERTGAPSGYILTQNGMERFEALAPSVESTEDGFKISTNKEPTQKQAAEGQWDVFISHAGEDKESFVEPLASALEQKGVRVWYDDFQLSIGDSIPKEIDKGLSQSEYGVVVLSDSFFQKDWPQEELQSLVHKNTNSEYNLILPVWYNIDREEVENNSPLLAARMAIPADDSSVVEVAERLVEEIESNEEDLTDLSQFDPRTVDFLADLIAQTWTGNELSRFFERQNIEIEWDEAKEGSIHEYISTFPVEAKERGIDLESARKSAVHNVLEEINQDESRSLRDLLETLAHPQSHIGNEERHTQIVSELDTALQYEGLRVNSEGEISKIEDSNQSD